LHWKATCPISIGSTFSHNEIGAPELGFKVKNLASQSIVAYELRVAFYDKFKEPVDAFGFGTNEKRLIGQSTIPSGQTESGGYYALYGLETARIFVITILRVKMADGTEWKPPEGYEVKEQHETR
jgi:hypothetical protein